MASFAKSGTTEPLVLASRLLAALTESISPWLVFWRGNVAGM